MTSFELLVDPRRMLRVTLVDAGGQEGEVAAVTCAYVPAAGADGVVRVAVEGTSDPAVPPPAAPYYCPTERLERRLLAPGRLRRIRPYRAG